MFERYALFYTPTGALADFGAAWLGWDSAAGRVVAQMDVSGIDVPQVTATPRKYGVHGTLKAPFHLTAGATLAALQDAAAAFTAQQRPCPIGPLELRHDAGFVALRPKTMPANLRDFAATIVTHFDPFRAPLRDADIARRRQAALSARQDTQMINWGYPYIFDDFAFHLTLTGRLPADDAATVIAALRPLVRPILPDPFVIDAITLMGQDQDGMFHQIHRYALTG